MEIFLIYIITLVITLSTLGYGSFTLNFLKINSENIGLYGIMGLFLLSIFSSYSHLLFPHNYIHNLIFILIGLLFFFKIKEKKLNNFKKIFIGTSLLFIFLLIAKNNEDFGYYHLPNSLQFSYYKLQFGLGNLNHGFKHISSLFMLMSLNYLPFLEYYLFNLTNFLFYLFFIIFLHQEIFSKKNLNLNFSKIFLSLFFVLFLTKFSRLAEFGSDLSGQIIICVYLFFILEIFFNTNLDIKKKNEYLSLSIILLIFAVTLKFILVIYSLFLLVMFILIYQKKTFFGLLNLRLFTISFAPLLIFVLLNFSATGCLIYPVEKLCFGNSFDWALKDDVIKYLNLHYELWSKAGRNPNFIVENPTEYIVGFNWINNWIVDYFYGKFTDYLLVILFIIIIFSLSFYKNYENINFTNITRNKFLIIYITTIIIFLIWLMNFPTLRYAGYIVTYLIFILPFSFIINKKLNVSKKENLNILFIILIISYSIFLLKNVQRVHSEMNLNANSDHNFLNFPFYWVKEQQSKKIEIDGYGLNLTKGACWSTEPTCIRGMHNLKIKIRNNYVFFVKENEK
tara:strand:+ start:2090 stop:3787 length:1698 start_codon:yes stop_codon:yes gene_type:complete